jgi:hypothetical protein
MATKKKSLQNAPYDFKYWVDRLTNSRNDHESFLRHADEAINIYARDTQIDDIKRQIGLWWYTVDTLLPVYCSRIPRVDVELRKKSGTIVDQLASQALERAAQYSIESQGDFQDTCQGFAKDTLMVGRAVSWVRYQPEMSDKIFEYSVKYDKDGMFVTAEGDVIDPTTVEIVSESGKSAVIRETVPAKHAEKAILERIHYKDYLVSPCRLPTEIEWKARRAFLDKEEVTQMFGKNLAKEVKYDVYPEDFSRRKESDDTKFDGSQKSEWQEIWCERTGKVYWICERSASRIIEVSEPPISFDDFYPCDEINTNQSPKSIIPVSDYWQAKDMIIEVERLTTRIAALIQAIKVSGAYDATLGDDLQNILSSDFKLTPIKRWPSYKNQRGGMANMIEMFDVTQYVSALNTAIAARQEILGKYYESMKMSDIVRGVTDAQETASAQQLKSGWASFGMQVRQNAFTKFVSKGITKVSKVIVEQFSDQHLFDMADGADLLNQAQQSQRVPPEFQWNAITEAMRAGITNYRIQAASDSFVEINQAQDREARKELMAGTGQFLSEMVPMIQQFPQMMPYAAEMMKYVGRSYRVGKELEATLEGAIAAIGQAIEAQKQAEAQNPQGQAPDPAVIVSNNELQIAQIKSQTEMQRNMITAEKNQGDIGIKSQQLQTDYEAKTADMMMQVQNMQLERERMEAELSMKQSELKLKEADLIISMHELQNKADANDQDMQAKAAIESAYIMLQQEKNDIERSRLKLNTAEARGNLQLKEVQAAADTEIRKVDTLGKLFTGAAKNVGQQQQNNQQAIRPGRSTNRPIV